MACARRLTSEPRFSRSASIGPAGQVGVEEQPGDALAVVVPAVVQHVSRPAEALDDEPVVVEEGRGHRGPAPARVRRRPARGPRTIVRTLARVTPSRRRDLGPVEPLVDQRREVGIASDVMAQLCHDRAWGTARRGPRNREAQRRRP